MRFSGGLIYTVICSKRLDDGRVWCYVTTSMPALAIVHLMMFIRVASFQGSLLFSNLHVRERYTLKIGTQRRERAWSGYWPWYAMNIIKIKHFDDIHNGWHMINPDKAISLSFLFQSFTYISPTDVGLRKGERERAWG